MNSKLIALDIGKKGGYAIFDNKGIISYGEIDTSSSLGLNLLSKLVAEDDISGVVFEKPFGITGNKNMNTFVNYGRIQAVPIMLNVPYFEVLPKTWTSFYRGIGSNKKKHSLEAIQILSKAGVEFDGEYILKKDGVADAILIANYYRILSKY